MSKQAFTDYFTGVVEVVTIIGWDGSKYATVKRINGEISAMRPVFIYKDDKMLTGFSATEWRLMRFGQIGKQYNKIKRKV